MSNAFEQQVLDAWPFSEWGDVRVLVAVSGGPDSVALLRALTTVRQTHSQGSVGSIEVAHFNHRWREGADLDASFVSDLAQQLNVPCQQGQASGPQSQTEDDARRLRYDFLRSTALQRGARYVVTGHTRDDQIETVLHRILRGTGIRGLAGIPSSRRLHEAVTVVRPLLLIRRKQILEYLSSLNQPYRSDESNTNTKYTRNRIRHRLLPTLERDFNPAVGDAITRLADLAEQSQAFMEAMTSDLALETIVSESPGRVELDRMKLANRDSAVVQELFRYIWQKKNWPRGRMGEKQWRRLAGLARQVSQPFLLPGNIRVTTTLQSLRIENVT